MAIGNIVCGTRFPNGGLGAVMAMELQAIEIERSAKKRRGNISKRVRVAPALFDVATHTARYWDVRVAACVLRKNRRVRSVSRACDFGGDSDIGVPITARRYRG